MRVQTLKSEAVKKKKGSRNRKNQWEESDGGYGG